MWTKGKWFALRCVSLIALMTVGCHELYGMDRVVLKKNKDFASQLTKTNTVYVIRHEFNLNDPEGKTPITVPDSCVFKFRRGCLKNGRIIGNHTQINAGSKRIFDLDLQLEGTWIINGVYPEWFGAKGDGKTDDTKAIQAAINSFPVVNLQSKTYLSNNVIVVGSGKTIIGKGNNSELKCTKEGCRQLFIKGNKTLLKGIIFNNVAKGYPDYGYDNGGVNSTNVVYYHGVEGIAVVQCSFKNAICGLYIHSACKDIFVEGCSFDCFKSLPDDHNNPRSGCAGGYGICLDADDSDNKDIDNIYRVKIRNCIFNNVQRHCLYIQCVYDCLVENNTFNANRNIVHPTPYDAVMMIYNSVGLNIINNIFNDALEAMHLEKIGVLPYNSNQLKNIIIENNLFYNCGDDEGDNGVIGADYGDDIQVINNHFYQVVGKMGAIIGLNHNSKVSVINNRCEISSKCTMNTNLVRYNSPNVKDIRIIGNTVDFTGTGKLYDKLIYTDYNAERIEIKENIVIGGNERTVIDIPNITNKTVSNNVKKIHQDKISECY